VFGLGFRSAILRLFYLSYAYLECRSEFIRDLFSRMTMQQGMLSKGRFSQSGQIYHVTICAAGRSPVFIDFYLARLVIQQMRLLHQSERVESIAFVVMPDHLHWLFQLSDTVCLSKLIKDFKGRTARLINQRLKKQGNLWQVGFHDHALRKDEELRKVACYIVANPLRANLVDDIGLYSHWDAKWVE
jgi:putative transposase